MIRWSGGRIENISLYFIYAARVGPLSKESLVNIPPVALRLAERFRREARFAWCTKKCTRALRGRRAEELKFVYCQLLLGVFISMSCYLITIVFSWCCCSQGVLSLPRWEDYLPNIWPPLLSYQPQGSWVPYSRSPVFPG